MDKYRVQPGSRVDLRNWDSEDTSVFGKDKEEGRKRLLELNSELEQLQELLFAEHKHKVLIVLQGMDTSGKDGTIRRVFEGVNPQGVRVAAFKKPTPQELDHDYLWRVHRQVPGRGEMVIFNRSHYEDVLVVRVHSLVPREVWSLRYDQINAFERMLAEEGTLILKFYLHIDKKEQLERLRDRLQDPTKHWKFNPADLDERKLWPQYLQAYEEALGRTSTEWAPWHIVPANRKWYRDLVVGSVIVAALQSLKMKYPTAHFDPAKIKLE